ncbi:MAG: RluA family pseudouridine synthase [Rhodocyclaceae bacterium]|nr:RluA family pseudouridine synthase [Rhodocyclaceae bacterium]
MAADYSPGSPGAIVATVPAECAGSRLDAALARMFPQHSRSRLQSWLREGRIRLDGGRADPRHKVWGGENIVLDGITEAGSMPDAPEDLALRVCHEDASILVLDKPPGLVVHPGSGNRTGTVLNGLLHRIPGLAALPRAGIVHRLDKDTSGLMVVAKTLEAQTDLVRQLQARTVRRKYLALVHGKVSPDGTVDAPIGRHPVHRTRMAVVAGGREARTHFFVIERFPGATLLECRLETGRTHQIRVHMDSIGHPLVGDPVYGRSRCGNPLLDDFPRQALHAWRLALRHPESGDEVAWESPVPADMANLLSVLRGT